MFKIIIDSLPSYKRIRSLSFYESPIIVTVRAGCYKVQAALVGKDSSL